MFGAGTDMIWVYGLWCSFIFSLIPSFISLILISFIGRFSKENIVPNRCKQYGTLSIAIVFYFVFISFCLGPGVNKEAYIGFVLIALIAFLIFRLLNRFVKIKTGNTFEHIFLNICIDFVGLFTTLTITTALFVILVYLQSFMHI